MIAGAERVAGMRGIVRRRSATALRQPGTLRPTRKADLGRDVRRPCSPVRIIQAIRDQRSGARGPDHCPSNRLDVDQGPIAALDDCLRQDCLMNARRPVDGASRD